jgi:hypothetical protein
MNGLKRKLEHRREVLASLQLDLSGTWPHYKGKNLEARREEVDQAIHETAEVAAVNMEWDNVAFQGLHRAIKMHLYRSDVNPAHRLARWHQYMTMVDRHTRAKLQVAGGSIKQTAKEFEKYKPFLEDVLFRNVEDLA